jgi:hypothetical protein
MKEERKKNTAKNKRAGSTKNICQRSTSLPRLRLLGLWHSKERNTLHKWKKSTIDAWRSTKNILIYFLELIPKNFGHSLGGYSHRERWACTQWYLFMSTEAKKVNEQSESSITPIGSNIFINLSNSNILYPETVKQGCDIWSSSCIIATKTRMLWFIMKVRPQDPSCEARYMHMDALCWYVSVSTTRRKSWWMHWVPWEPLGFILCKS